MKEIIKADLKDNNDIVREIINSCILDANFYIKYKIPDAQGNLMVLKGSKPNGNAVVPVADSSNQAQNNVADANKPVLQDSVKTYERIMIKAI